MPRPRTEPYWKRRIHEIDGAEPRISVAAIELKLEQEAARMDPYPTDPQRKDAPTTDPPRGNTIGRIRRELPEAERVTYRPVVWPESFGGPGLPQESARAVFALWRCLGRRPSVRLASAFWKVTLATGENVPVEARYGLATRLMNYDPREVEQAIVAESYAAAAFETPMVPASLEDMRSGAIVDSIEEITGQMEPEQRAAYLAAMAGYVSLAEWKEASNEPQG